MPRLSSGRSPSRYRPSSRAGGFARLTCGQSVIAMNPETRPATASVELRRHHQKVEANFCFLRMERHYCEKVVAEAHIVITTAFTIPGTDALTVGKRVVYYNELGGGGHVFAGFPHLVAQSPDEPKRLFALALEDYGEYALVHEYRLRRLDPFRDGKARQRIIDALLGASETMNGAVRWVTAALKQGDE